MTDNDDHYLIPEHPGEVNRLDLQHYALREALGTNHLAPIDDPASVLDAGAGTGQWAFEVGAEFPRARIVGIDRGAGVKSAGMPPNFTFVRGDLLRPLPFAAGSFDYVHQRLLRSAIPVVRYPDEVAELARVTAPGGWVELVETENGLEPAGPATTRLNRLIFEMAGNLGLDSVGPPEFSMRPLAERAGLEDIVVRRVEVPMGAWGGRPGSFLAAEFRTGMAAGIPRMAEMVGVPADEISSLMTDMLYEIEENHSVCHLEVTLGRKPAP